MKLFRSEKHLTIPEPFTADDIRTESSICTGERTIGFYDRSSRRLMYAELVESENDIVRFYAKYGLSYPSNEKTDGHERR